MNLDHSTLAVQGPPGSGKTYNGARMAISLVAAGRKVGVTATSHKVIGNLLTEIAKAGTREGIRVQIGQKPGPNDPPTHDGAQVVDTPAALAGLAAGTLDVVGGTPWLWAEPEMIGSVDVLIVDEAGQMSLANVLASAAATASLILIGDPQQLDQPLKGSHPPGAERSALGHVLDDRQTIADDAGLFIDRTWRLHPDICDFTSEVFYGGALEPQPENANQRLEGTPPLGGTGIRWIPVDHRDNSVDSPEEAARIRALVDSLLGAEACWTNPQREVAPISLSDIVIVAPYNAHVDRIAQALPKGARVGTVDKFQGQQAPVSIYAMATSSPELAPRGMEFLYSLNRLNVATSRARCVAAVVAAPALLRVQCKTPRQMRLANALARLVEMADGVGPARPQGEGAAGGSAGV